MYLMTNRNYAVLLSRKIDGKNASTVHLLHFPSVFHSTSVDDLRQEEQRFPLLFKLQKPLLIAQDSNRFRVFCTIAK